MGESGISSWFSCSCAACCAWRRLGSLLRPCHANTDLKKYVIGLLRFAAADLSEFQDRVFPGVALAEVAPGVEKSEEKSESPGKEESPKERSRSPSEKRKKSKESKGKQKALEKSQKKEKKRRRHKSRPRSPRSLPRKSHHNAGGAASGSRPEVGSRVKEEPSEAVLDKSPLASVVGEDSPDEAEVREDRGRRSTPGIHSSGGEAPVVRERPRLPDREEARSRSRSRHEDLPSRPPGRWTLAERPPEPSVPPRSFRPPEPPRPPPGWAPPRVAFHSSRSKGATRRERNADIFLFGPSSERKRQREERRRG